MFKLNKCSVFAPQSVLHHDRIDCGCGDCGTFIWPTSAEDDMNREHPFTLRTVGPDNFSNTVFLLHCLSAHLHKSLKKIHASTKESSDYAEQLGTAYNTVTQVKIILSSLSDIFMKGVIKVRPFPTGSILLIQLFRVLRCIIWLRTTVHLCHQHVRNVLILFTSVFLHLFVHVVIFSLPYMM